MKRMHASFDVYLLPPMRIESKTTPRLPLIIHRHNVGNDGRFGNSWRASLTVRSVSFLLSIMFIISSLDLRFLLYADIQLRQNFKK